jgi:hypothetical protein
VPDGTPASWKYPEDSTGVERLVPTTLTVKAEASATGAVAAVVGAAPEDAALAVIADAPFIVTMPEIVVPSILDGPAGPPPHAAAIARSIRHDPMIRVRLAVNTSPPVIKPVFGSR